jgi:hypothetical protein
MMGLAMAMLVSLVVPVASAEEDALVIFDFEGSTQEWAIPEWALSSPDHSGTSLMASQDFVSSGRGSLQMLVNFPGQKWNGAYLERMMYVTDWTPFSSIAVDVYVPYNAPMGLKGRFILTAGDQWTWTEMNRGMALVPDQWTTLTANLKPGSLDWKFFPDEKFRADIRKIGIRVESDGPTYPAYTGPVYVDRVRLIKSAQ